MEANLTTAPCGESRRAQKLPLSGPPLFFAAGYPEVEREILATKKSAESMGETGGTKSIAQPGPRWGGLAGQTGLGPSDRSVSQIGLCRRLRLFDDSIIGGLRRPRPEVTR